MPPAWSRWRDELRNEHETVAEDAARLASSRQAGTRRVQGAGAAPGEAGAPSLTARTRK
jgi:hypothetical protein